MLKGDALKEALDYALFLGYRHIDTATAYENEEEIGQVIDDRVKSGQINRKDLFITTKVYSSRLRKADAIDSAQQSLAKLRINYVDMLLIHHPWAHKINVNGEIEFEDVNFLETWLALSHLFKSGKASSIGVSNFTINQINRVLSFSDVPLANVQLEAHAYLQQEKLKVFCDMNNIIVSAYAPLGAPNRPSMHISNQEILLRDPLILEMAESYKKTPAQVLLNFLLQRGFVVLPKSSSRNRIKENFEALDWTMSTKDFDKITSLNQGVRFFRFLLMKGHPEFFENEDF